MYGRSFGIAGVVAVIVVLTVNLAAPPPAEGFIHEIIAAMCRAVEGDVEPPGQSSGDSKAFVRALMATGFIVSITNESPTRVVITFDPTVPNSKFMSAGFDEEIPDGAGPGVTLVLHPFVIPNPDFPAHAHCRNLR